MPALKWYLDFSHNSPYALAVADNTIQVRLFVAP